MKTFQQQVNDALASDDARDQLGALLGWDVDDDPTTAQMNAVATLMGWSPRSDRPTVTTYANTVSDETLLAIFQENGIEVRHSIMTHWEWQGWRAEKWDNPQVGNGIYFYNPICKSTTADAYEVLCQI